MTIFRVTCIGISCSLRSLSFYKILRFLQFFAILAAAYKLGHQIRRCFPHSRFNRLQSVFLRSQVRAGSLTLRYTDFEIKKKPGNCYAVYFAICTYPIIHLVSPSTHPTPPPRSSPHILDNLCFSFLLGFLTSKEKTHASHVSQWLCATIRCNQCLWHCF